MSDHEQQNHQESDLARYDEDIAASMDNPSFNPELQKCVDKMADLILSAIEDSNPPRVDFFFLLSGKSSPFTRLLLSRCFELIAHRRNLSQSVEKAFISLLNDRVIELSDTENQYMYDFVGFRTTSEQHISPKLDKIQKTSRIIILDDHIDAGLKVTTYHEALNEHGFSNSTFLAFAGDSTYKGDAAIASTDPNLKKGIKGIAKMMSLVKKMKNKIDPESSPVKTNLEAYENKVSDYVNRIRTFFTFKDSAARSRD